MVDDKMSSEFKPSQVDISVNSERHSDSNIVRPSNNTQQNPGFKGNSSRNNSNKMLEVPDKTPGSPNPKKAKSSQNIRSPSQRSSENIKVNAKSNSNLDMGMCIFIVNNL